jgi:hypothetical protein
MSNNSYYVYAHINIITNVIFYIGKGIGGRCDSLLGRSKYWGRIVNKYGYDTIIIEDTLTNDQALEREIYWIKRIGRKNEGGSLINMTDGGDGGDTISNHPNRSEIILKISASNKGANNPNYGGKFITDEFIKKQIDSNSKKHLKVTDTKNNEILFFKNSKECALALNAKASNVRMCKNKYKLHKRYVVEDVELILQP